MGVDQGSGFVVKPSEACIDFIKSFEGFRANAYLCPAGVPTVGYGHIEYVTLGDTVTEEEACELLKQDVQEAADAVDDLVDVELTQGQYDALCSFIYNLGRTVFANSTLLKMLNQGKSAKEVGPQFLRWNKSKGTVLTGLTRRREDEKRMFEL